MSICTILRAFIWPPSCFELSSLVCRFSHSLAQLMVNVIVILRSNSRRKIILGHRYARWLVGPCGACFARAGGAYDALPEVRAPAQEPHRRHSCLGMEPAGIPFLQEGEEVNCNLREQSERRDRAPLLKESMKVVRGHFRLQENKWLNRP